MNNDISMEGTTSFIISYSSHVSDFGGIAASVCLLWLFLINPSRHLDTTQPATDHPINITTPIRRNPLRLARLICFQVKRRESTRVNHDDELPAASSSPAVSPSNHQSLALVLPVVGFHWDLKKWKDEVERQSYALSFDVEWNLFIKLVIQITDIHPKTNAITSEVAWKCFEHVIMPTYGANNVVRFGHDTEGKFDDALFRALRKSLKGFVKKVAGKIGKNWIVLHNSHIGFGQKIERTTLGFKPGYALSRNSIPDHGCYVLGTDAIEALNMASVAKATASKRTTFDGKKVFWYNDMTSTVELKLEGSSCQYFGVENNFIKKPEFSGTHGPMGQAMLYSMDVWHCLARRGVFVEKVPVVVLAGKSKYPIQNEVCCLQAHLKIPKNCRPGFVYSVDEIVAFDGTAGLSQRDRLTVNPAFAMKHKESRDERAIAIYIRTMRIGLENAMKVIEKCNMPDSVVFPVSLGCYPLLQDGSIAHLVASPISREPRYYNYSLNVHQGELFSLSNLTESTFAGFKRLHWFIEPNEFNNHHDCLVKVSCLSVHHTYIKHGACEKALLELHHACAFKENEKMKKSVANVLLGFFYVVESTCLVTIMKDLQKENFQILEHQAIHDQQKLPELWRAFRTLVTSLLLPLAEKGIIHHDIRSSIRRTCNILIRNNRGKIQLCLIDFESLIFSEAALDDDIEKHGDAVHCTDLHSTVEDGSEKKSDLHSTVKDESEQKSALRYLFWQVLWIAYRWHLPPSSMLASKENQKNLTARDFALIFLNDADYAKRKGPLNGRTDYGEFKQWLGKHRKTLENVNAKIITNEDIPTALHALLMAFQRDAVHKELKVLAMEKRLLIHNEPPRYFVGYGNH